MEAHFSLYFWAEPAIFLKLADFGQNSGHEKTRKVSNHAGLLVVPGGGLEPPTFGL
tara:strand:+ start:895 stop:1062 length:168 start_codon:yes stop_codon:yes gene_type:complete